MCTDVPVNDEDGDEDEDGQHRQRSSNHIADVKSFTFFSNKEKRGDGVRSLTWFTLLRRAAN